jgi:hypothetical protein
MKVSRQPARTGAVEKQKKEPALQDAATNERLVKSAQKT